MICALAPQRALRLSSVLAYAFPMRYVLGFDGGGTKTDCVLMDESGAILARSRSRPSNPSPVPLDLAYAAFLQAADKALHTCGKSMTHVVRVCGEHAAAP